MTPVLRAPLGLLAHKVSLDQQALLGRKEQRALVGTRVRRAFRVFRVSLDQQAHREQRALVGTRAQLDQLDPLAHREFREFRV